MGVILHITEGAIWWAHIYLYDIHVTAKYRWFDGHDIHGTVSPTIDALKNTSAETAVSDGFVIVLREKDAKAAAMPMLTKFWSK